MRVPLGYTITATTNANFRAGAIYVEVHNNSVTASLSILFAGADGSNNIVLKPGQIRVFPLLGSQGYAAFTLFNPLGGVVNDAFVLIIN